MIRCCKRLLVVITDSNESIGSDVSLYSIECHGSLEKVPKLMDTHKLGEQILGASRLKECVQDSVLRFVCVADKLVYLYAIEHVQSKPSKYLLKQECAEANKCLLSSVTM